MTAKRYQPQLGKNQKLAMSVLADHGVWQAGAPYGVGTDHQTGLVMAGLVGRALVRLDRHERYCLTMAGYAWLLRQAADDLGMTTFGSDASKAMVNRIQRFAQCALLTGVHKNSPVDWRGDPV